LRGALEAVGSGASRHLTRTVSHDLVDVVTYHDHFLVSADFDSYAAAQKRVASKWRDQDAWWRSSILNTAGVGWFSSDRAIREYCDDIWNVKLST
jgi:starch phosphorylase